MTNLHNNGPMDVQNFEAKNPRILHVCHGGPDFNEEEGSLALPNYDNDIIYSTVAAVFKPTCFLLFRTDPQKKHLIGALCGLGWDEETGGPALPDHDMEVTFDTRIDLDDICKVLIHALLIS